MRRLLVGLAIASIAVLSPCWAHADDQQIAQDIVHQLRQQKDDGNLTGFSIDLEVESGIVWLKGHVTSRQQQQAVLDIARNVEGVEQVVNDLSVKAAATRSEDGKSQPRSALLRPKAGETKSLKKPSDVFAGLNKSVQKVLGNDGEAAEKEAETSSSDVVAASATEATPVAQRGDTASTDAGLASEVISRLRTQKDRGTLRNFDVDVQVKNRVVWISGRVASEQQQTLVLDVARRVRGVKQVVNDLQVETAQVQRVSAPSQEGGQLAPAPAQLLPMTNGGQTPLAFAPAQSAMYAQQMMGQPVPEVPAAGGIARARFDNPTMPAYAWPSYAAYPNYGAVTYPRQYSPTAWPYIGPFYPYPQVPLGWRKVTLKWDDGWWNLDFKAK